MQTNVVYCGRDAIDRFVAYCQAQGLERFLVVSDANTHAVLGRAAEARLRARGWTVESAILREEPVLADEQSVFAVLQQAAGRDLTYVAAGSGTITDITRYASSCARTPFVSLPTAPSMDGYASGGAALTIRGFKLTVPCHAPVAVFADLPVLCAAPQEMIGAGFGDMVGKYIALADWKLGALLAGESYSAAIAQRTEQALRRCVQQAAAIGQAEEAGITRLTEGLLDSGLCMQEQGSSRPASGFEHQLSHFWEMTLQHRTRRPLLHGAKVGVATALAAQLYQTVRGLSHEEAIKRLASVSLPSSDDEIAQIRAAYGSAAAPIIASYLPYHKTIAAARPALVQKVGEVWPQIQDIAAGVPSPHEIETLLRLARAPVTPAALALGKRPGRLALANAHYLRNRITIDTLGRLLCLW